MSMVKYWDLGCSDSYASVELPPSWFVMASATWGECPNYQCTLTRGPRQPGPSERKNVLRNFSAHIRSRAQVN